MKPLDQLREVYRRNRRKISFDQDLAEHLDSGIVISTPDSFIMCRIVELEDGRQAWAIGAAAGNLRQIVRDCLRLYPMHLPWTLFCRHGQDRVRLYPTEKLFRKILC